MPKKDPRVAVYISNAHAFARPILRHIRTLVHKSCPGATETIKWGFPVFEYHGILCGMAAFKQHCTFFFWKAALLSDPHGILEKRERTAMGQFGRISQISDLPAVASLRNFVRQAAILNEGGIKTPKKPAPAKAQRLIIPPAFKSALKKHKRADANFKDFSYAHKKEYCAWIAEAKREETRERRIATAIGWIAKGKGRNWKYENSR
jgi:uncharacterized protein YdeI (YjbR/CyaY-like superfamily)